MEGIIVWSAILIPSALVGLLCGYFSKGKLGFYLSAAMPWLGTLGDVGDIWTFEGDGLALSPYKNGIRILH